MLNAQRFFFQTRRDPACLDGSQAGKDDTETKYKTEKQPCRTAVKAGREVWKKKIKHENIKYAFC